MYIVSITQLHKGRWSICLPSRHEVRAYLSGFSASISNLAIHNMQDHRCLGFEKALLEGLLQPGSFAEAA